MQRSTNSVMDVLVLERGAKLTRIITGCDDGKVRITEAGKAEPVLHFIASPGW